MGSMSLFYLSLEIEKYLRVLTRKFCSFFTDGRFKLLSGQHIGAAVKIVFEAMKKNQVPEAEIPASYKSLEAEVLKVGTERNICHLFAGMGQSQQESHGLSNAEVMSYHMLTIQEMNTSAGRPWLTDKELWFHLQAAGLLTKEKRDTAARTTTGNDRTEKEIERTLVCYITFLRVLTRKFHCLSFRRQV